MPRLLVSILFFLTAAHAQAGSSEDCGLEGKACVAYGARVFQARCALCHGSDGLGEGILSLSLKDYPNTNLLDPQHDTSHDSVSDIVQFGGGVGNISSEMPPWGDELTAAQLSSVVEFVVYLRANLDGALEHLKKAAENMEPSLKIGRAVFQGRCSLCHGKYGLGDGKMARIIKDPPPFNLTLSHMPDSYLDEIIHKGGGALGRSPRMPPFGGDLSEPEISSVIMYLKTLRTE